MTFSGIRNFDLHRTGGICSHPMRLGLTERDRIWGNHGTRPPGTYGSH